MSDFTFIDNPPVDSDSNYTPPKNAVKILASNNQEAFDLVLRNILEQGVQCLTLDLSDYSTEGEMQCAYTNDKGHACAVGQLIPESDRAGMPNMNVGSLEEQGYLDIQGVDLQLLQSMQSAHDHCQEVEFAHPMLGFRATMRDIAVAYELSFHAG